MVGVVGSNPIEPTNDIGFRPDFRAGAAVENFYAKGEYGYDTANVDRNDFGATLVEEPFRLAVSEVSKCGPSKAGPHFFCLYFNVLLACRSLSASRRLLWFRYACLTAQFDNTSIR
jgi:hypothetical protein